MIEAWDTEGVLRQAREGDSQGLRRLFDRFARPLELFIRREMRPALMRHEDPGGLVNEVFLKAFQSIETFEYRSSGSFYAWLVGIARNVLRDHHKWIDRLKRDSSREVGGTVGGSFESDPTLIESLPERRSPSPSSRLSCKEAVEVALQEMEALSERDRHVLQLRLLEGMSCNEVGERLGMTPEQVQMRQFRALERIRKRMNL